MERVALLDEQQPEQGVHILLLAVILPLDDGIPLLECEIELRIEGRGEDIRLQLTLLLGGQDTDAGGQIVVDLHEANGDQTVEPGIGYLLHDEVVGSFVVTIPLLIMNGLHQRLTLFDLVTGNGSRCASAGVEELHIAGGLGQRLLNTVLPDTHQAALVGNAADQSLACPDGKIFDRGFIHNFNPLSGTWPKLVLIRTQYSPWCPLPERPAALCEAHGGTYRYPPHS